MLLDFIAFLLLFAITLFVGLPLIPKKFGISGTRKIFVGNLVGICILCVSASWIVALGLSIKYLYVAITGLAILSIYRFRNFKTLLRPLKLHYSQNRLLALVYIPVFMLISSVHNPSLFQSFLSFRNGPDLVGWASGVKFFSNDSKLDDLRSQILTELGASDFLSTLKLPGSLNQTFLYKLPSFTDQVNAEFLLGAHRTGLPAFLGAIDHAFGSNFTFHLVVGMQALICVLIFGITLEFLRSKGLGIRVSILLSATGTFNLGVLSVLLEGGMGQVLMLPYLALFLTILFRSETTSFELFSIIFLVTLVSLSTYLDFLFFFAPLSLLILIKVWKLKSNYFFSSLELFSGYLAGGIISWPIFTSLQRLFLDRFFGHPGGWNMGRLPFLTDIFGFLNWLPSDSISVFKNQLMVLTISFLFSLILVYFFVTKLEPAYRLVSFTFVLCYSLIALLVYSKNEVNNYPLFKAAAYFAIFVPFMLFGFHQKQKRTSFRTNNGDKIYSEKNRLRPNQNKSFSREKNPISKQPLSSFVVLLSCAILLSSTNWTAGWFENRQQSLRLESVRILQPILQEYDVLASGFFGAGSAKLVLLGDIRYVSVSRGFNSTVLRSTPKRKLAFFLDKSLCKSTKSCVVNYQGSQVNLILLADIDEFDVYSES
jgi:hypothetical protein